jgi:hypothetical protein
MVGWRRLGCRPTIPFCEILKPALVVEPVYTSVLKTGTLWVCGFESRQGHQFSKF